MAQSAWAGCVLGFMHFGIGRIDDIGRTLFGIGRIDQNMSALAQGLLGQREASVLGRERVLANQEYRRAQHAKRKRDFRSPPGRERIDGKPRIQNSYLYDIVVCHNTNNYDTYRVIFV